MTTMSWHRTTARKAWGGWGTQYRASSINRATEPASKRRPEYPMMSIRPAPWRRLLSRTAIDSACAAPAPPQARSGNLKTKLQRSQDFCFLTRKIAATGRSGRWRAGRMVAGGTDERGETRNGMRNGRNDLRCARRTERECDDEISLFCTLGQIKPDFLAR